MAWVGVCGEMVKGGALVLGGWGGGRWEDGGRDGVVMVCLVLVYGLVVLGWEVVGRPRWRRVEAALRFWLAYFPTAAPRCFELL